MLALRNALGLTQDQLAARGDSEAHRLDYRDVLNIEKNRNRATSGRLREALAMAVEVDVPTIRDYLEGQITLEQLLEERKRRPMKLAMQVFLESRALSADRLQQIVERSPAPEGSSALRWVLHIERMMRHGPKSDLQRSAEAETEELRSAHETVSSKFAPDDSPAPEPARKPTTTRKPKR
jgi:transcriptional regulator with XRE-family HTH domain